MGEDESLSRLSESTIARITGRNIKFSSNQFDQSRLD